MGAPGWNGMNLPPFLTDNPMPQGYPWGGMTANNTNYYESWPDTGVTRYYDFTVARGACSPGTYQDDASSID